MEKEQYSRRQKQGPQETTTTTTTKQWAGNKSRPNQRIKE
jgi:hypothetical protein